MYYRISVYLQRETNNTAAKDTKKGRDRRMLNPKSERTMKTYRTSEHVARLASYLVATCKPFAFDGQIIEFTASEKFINQLKHDDAMFSTVNFEIL